jgi:hypothetical protein
MGGVWLCVAGLTIEIASWDESTRELLTHHWPEFFHEAPPSPTDLIMDVAYDPALKEAWTPSSQGELSVVREGPTWTFRRVDFVGTWTPETRQVKVRHAGALPFISSFLRVMTCAVLSGRKGALVHASSVRTPHGVVLFPGPSGTGKSTVAGLAAAGTVLSDEVSCVHFVGDEPFASPTPFWGDLPRTRASEGGRLRAIILLERDELTTPPTPPTPASVVPARSAEVLATLMHCAFAFDGGAIDKRALIDTMTGVARRVPSFVLRYRAPNDPWPIVLAALRDLS